MGKRLLRWLFWRVFRSPSAQHKIFQYLYEQSAHYQHLTAWERIQCYAALFNTNNGEFVLWDMWKSYADRSSFDTAKPEYGSLAFREGQRSVYQGILRVLEQARHPEWFKDKEK